jgi:hypothetical protein
MNEEIRIIRTGSRSLAVVAVLLLTACQASTVSGDLPTTAATGPEPAAAVAVRPDAAQCPGVGAPTRKVEHPVKLRKERARSTLLRARPE